MPDGDGYPVNDTALLGLELVWFSVLFRPFHDCKDLPER